MKTNRVADPKWKLTLVRLLSVFCISWGCTTTQVVCPVGQPCDSYTEAHILASARSLHTGNLRGTAEILSPWLQQVGKPSLEEAAEQVKERRDPRNFGGYFRAPPGWKKLLPFRKPKRSRRPGCNWSSLCPNTLHRRSPCPQLRGLREPFKSPVLWGALPG